MNKNQGIIKQAIIIAFPFLRNLPDSGVRAIKVTQSCSVDRAGEACLTLRVRDANFLKV